MRAALGPPGMGRNMTTIENVTAGQIRRLADAAGEAGDLKQVELCKRALTINRAIVEVLSDDEEAISACVKAINAAEAME